MTGSIYTVVEYVKQEHNTKEDLIQILGMVVLLALSYHLASTTTVCPQP